MRRGILFLAICLLSLPLQAKQNQVISARRRAASGAATWTHIQDNNAYGGSNCTSGITCKFNSNVTAGNLLQVWGEQATGTGSATDALGNTWICPSAAAGGGPYFVSGCYTVTTSSGADTVTISGPGFQPMAISEDHKSSGTITFDQAATQGFGGGGTTTPSTGSITTTHSNELVTAMFVLGANTTITYAGGYTAFTTTVSEGAGEYLLGAATGTYNPSLTLGVATSVFCGGMTFY